ncbi:DoxX family protein [Candidatus Methylacidiphilum fumarolicum]|uniref:DoxX family protein n=2 Tax=Candidatus Methylacidiphilum fumarolicum TaxID=591154 RepID=I0JZ29_METFB|nr:DoxX family protein [Candidatus Methylacidiphilum fumarolicum]MBW6414656.1 DoxX family protein [Candidatus Methylacidiphilum fumarolicum]TFE74228.1 DoxX family protein [Candidatus Methylacidiphilum fumarolicum]TFE75727.1 DoxX family protein [Candidatus Methylacidiphilum fumarolicum]CAI9084801.1 Membrane protein, distant similarity to thiosulphate:quinone oxidoreductase DoxD [Candidatus Methylacidiphilum fumarolicum]CCG92498.1 DoxX family protein [Methylacidiphilum fumariolicum SolV]
MKGNSKVAFIMYYILRTTPSFAFLPLRLVLSLIFFAHGSQKLFGWFGGKGLEATALSFAEKFHLVPGILWASLAGGGEFLGAILLALGLATRLAAFNLVVIMSVAILVVHRHAFFVHDGGMEYALSLWAGALSLVVGGGGFFSLDRQISRRMGGAQ